MSIGLRSAFIISIMIHAGIVAPLYNHNLLRHDFAKRDDVIVDYIVLRQISNFVPANISVKETVAVEQPSKEDIKNTLSDSKGVIKHSKLDYRKKLEALRLKEKRNVSANAAAASGVPGGSGNKEAQIKSSKDYINYYGFLKEKIKARLQENYRFYNREGDVYLTFVLNDKGVLLNYNIDRSRSCSDEVLLHITCASLVAVAPFPPLPKVISQPQMSFNITISFKKQ